MGHLRGPRVSLVSGARGSFPQCTVVVLITQCGVVLRVLLLGVNIVHGVLVQGLLRPESLIDESLPGWWRVSGPASTVNFLVHGETPISSNLTGGFSAGPGTAILGVSAQNKIGEMLSPTV